MILEFVFNCLFRVLYTIIGVFPDVNWSVSKNVIDTVSGIIRTSCYFFPMDTVVAILAIIIWVNMFKIGVSFLKTLWDIIPFL